MRLRLVTAALAGTMALAAVAAPRGQQTPPGRAPIFRGAAELVRVDVVVRDREGNVVRGLTAADFTVAEEGRPQQIVSFAFEEIRTDPLPPLTVSAVLGMDQLQAAAAQRSIVLALPGGVEPASPPPPAPEPAQADDLSGRRMIVLLFDTSSMQPEEIERAVTSAHDYVETQMTAADLVAVATVGQSLTILRDFTSDRDLLRTTLDGFDVTAGAGFEQPEAVEAVEVTEETADADPADLPLDDGEFGIFNNDRRLRAMRVLCTALEALEQKKALLYFSSGMSRSGSDNQVELRAVTNTCNRANTSIYPVDSRGLAAIVPGGAPGGGRGGRGGGGRGGAGASVFSGRSMISQFSALNASQETLSTLAADTGGEVFLDSNDFGPAFTRVLHDMTAYYLLGYRSTNSTPDGKFRRITVRLRNTGTGYRVEARTGYYAKADFAHLGRDDRERQLQEQIASAVSSTDLPVVAATSWFRMPDNRFYVPVSLAVPGSHVRVPTAAQLDRQNASVDVLGVVTDEQGRVVGRIRDTMQIPAAQAAALVGKQLQYQSGVTLPAGHFKVKVAVRENADGMMGTFEFPIAIPDLRAEPIKVSPIVLSTQLRSMRGGGPGARGGRGGPAGQLDPGGRGLNSRRGGGGAQWGNSSPNPLLRNGQEIVQSLSHVVLRTQPMYFYFEVYDPATGPGGATNVRASLAFYRGRVKVFETPVTARIAIDDPDRQAAIFQLQVPAAGLTPGLYTCQVNIIDEVAGRFAFPRLAVYVRGQ